MQRGSIDFPPILTTNFEEDVEGANTDVKKCPCRGNTSADVYSPS